MGNDILNFHEIDSTRIADVGGKGANLGELARIDGVRVPPGFCITTDVYCRFVAKAASLRNQIDRLSQRLLENRSSTGALSADIREGFEKVDMPSELFSAVSEALRRVGQGQAWAVRSSATAEDLPTASFAGQQDSFLNIIDPAAIVEHVRRCWASLFTERAVAYRQRNGIDHAKTHMAVIVQQMVSAEASGLLFTADPVTGNRKITTIEANYGLGEALVSGLVNADNYKVRDGHVVARAIGTKSIMIQPSDTGGTVRVAIGPDMRSRAVLTDEQVAHLSALGQRIATHFGSPQDIEWCLQDTAFQIVQSRPITTLFPIPKKTDDANHVYVSVGHQQMMTDAMKPLGLSLWQLTTRRPMAEAGSRLFVDVTPMLAAPGSRANLLDTLGKSDPLIRDALETVLERGDFIATRTSDESAWTPPGRGAHLIETDRSQVDELIARSQAAIAATKQIIQTKSGTALFDSILADIEATKAVQFESKSLQVLMAGIEAAWWLNDKMQEWLGENNAADILAQSAPGNITSEMGLELLDVADAIRPHPEVISFLEQVNDEDFLEALPKVPGGNEARAAIRKWLDKYGMRGVGEIDITRPRWSERPTTLLSMLLSNIKNFEQGAAKNRFAQGQREAAKKENDLLTRLRSAPDGAANAEETKRMIDRLRTFIGYREYPKYAMAGRYFVYKQALMEEAERLVGQGVLRETEDIFYLRFDELHEVARSAAVDQELIRKRRDEYKAHQSLTPPRVLTSDGEMLSGSYRRGDVPGNALVGLPVSAGIVEGRARVISNLSDAAFEPGDILVTRFTDPSWTPLFVSIAGLVTEVGGMMTHGAVIAREYGLPAVVGVENATRLIKDGQRIRVYGTNGYVALLT